MRTWKSEIRTWVGDEDEGGIEVRNETVGDVKNGDGDMEVERGDDDESGD